ncbi:MAG: cupin domain-containing protein [Chloroflexota bacterium]|jgi:quercetin dioxygenase-like cupin family protein|nr:cupin domain-containing protein [Chloroflexota bacterium]
MPIEIRPFGVGHRRPDGPPGSTGVTGQIVHSDGRGTIAEVAFVRGAVMEPHVSPNTSWLLVIEGGGWTGVGDERARIAAGEAVLWPADVPHAAWTEHSEMRAFVIDFAGADDAAARGLLEGRAMDVSGHPGEVERGVGALRPGDAGTSRRDPDAGEPA